MLSFIRVTVIMLSFHSNRALQVRLIRLQISSLFLYIGDQNGGLMFVKKVFFTELHCTLFILKKKSKEKGEINEKIIKGNRKHMEPSTDFIKLKTIFSETQAMRLYFEMVLNPT